MKPRSHSWVYSPSPVCTEQLLSLTMDVGFLTLPATLWLIHSREQAGPAQLPGHLGIMAWADYVWREEQFY